MKILVVTHGVEFEKIRKVLDRVEELGIAPDYILITRVLPDNDPSQAETKENILRVSDKFSSEVKSRYSNVMIDVLDLSEDEIVKNVYEVIQRTYDKLPGTPEEKARYEVYVYMAGGTTPLQQSIMIYSQLDPRVVERRTYSRKMDRLMAIDEMFIQVSARKDLIKRYIAFLSFLEESDGTANIKNIGGQVPGLGRGNNDRSIKPLRDKNLVIKKSGRGKIYLITDLGRLYRRIWEIMYNRMGRR